MSNEIFCADNLFLIMAVVQFVTLQSHVYESLYIVYTIAIDIISRELNCETMKSYYFLIAWHTFS